MVRRFENVGDLKFRVYPQLRYSLSYSFDEMRI